MAMSGISYDSAPPGLQPNNYYNLLFSLLTYFKPVPLKDQVEKTIEIKKLKGDFSDCMVIRCISVPQKAEL
jgi:hypothetical protein